MVTHGAGFGMQHAVAAGIDLERDSQ